MKIKQFVLSSDKPAELRNGFVSPGWMNKRDFGKLVERDNGIELVCDFPGNYPLSFAAPVKKQGNYQISITLFPALDCEEVLIFLGRRLLVDRVSLKKNEPFKKTYTLSVLPIIPRESQEAQEINSLICSVVGKGILFADCQIKEVATRTLFIAGDSTVADQSSEIPYEPGLSYCGWGQMLPLYLETDLAVSNHSHSGLTTESFKSEGHYQVMVEQMKAFDLCLIQFGHNDQKLAHLKATEGYRKNLENYIKELRAMQVIPILVTPLARNTWKGSDQTYNDLLEEYAKAVIKVGEQMQVPVIDLHGQAKDWIIEQGREEMKKYFFPSDYTHTNDYGGVLFAKIISNGLYKEGLIASLREQESWVPPVCVNKPFIPEAKLPQKELELPALLAEEVDSEETLIRHEGLSLIAQALKYFGTNVYNDLFEDVIGHETYAGMIECAVQNGIFSEEEKKQPQIYPNEAITKEQFYQWTKNGYLGRSSNLGAFETIFAHFPKNQEMMTKQEGILLLREVFSII